MEPKSSDCAVCHDTFSVPKILPCGHILCRDCLRSWLQSQPQATCPLCYYVLADLGPEGRSVENLQRVADSLPTDLALTAVVEAEALLSKQYPCCVCEDVVAVARCLQCGDVYCQTCCNLHKKQNVSKHHEVADLNALTTVKLAGYHPATCPDHGDRVCELYCPTHGVSLCLLCATTTHRSCPTVVSLQSHLNELSAELVEISQKLSDAMVKAEDTLTFLDKYVDETKRDSSAALDEVKVVCERLRSAFMVRFDRVNDLTVKLVSEVARTAVDMKQSIIQTRSKLITYKAMTEFYQKFKEHKDFKDMVDVAKVRVQGLDLNVSLPENMELSHKLFITIDQESVAHIEEAVSLLGHFSKISAEDCENEETSSKHSNDEEIHNSGTADSSSDSSSSERKQRPQFQETLGKAIKFDPMTATPSKITAAIDTSWKTAIRPLSIACTIVGPSEEELFIVDSINNTVKVFSLTTNRLLAVIRLFDVPHRMARASDNFLVVTSLKRKVLTFVDIADVSHPRQRYTVETLRLYHGISVVKTHRDGPLLVVSCGSDETGPSSVDVITLTGQLLRTILTSQIVPHLTSPSYLHVDAKRAILYVSDADAQSVFSVHLITGAVRQMKHPQMKYPRQVCTDSAGNLYVVSDLDPCVLTQSVDGAWRVLLTGPEHGEDGSLVHPTGVSVTSTELLVSWGPSAVTRYAMVTRRAEGVN